MISSFKRSAAAAFVGFAMLTACGGGGGGSLPATSLPAQAQPNPAGNLSPNASSIPWGQPVLSQLPYLGPVKAGTLSMAVGVRMQNAAGLVQYAQQASDPSSGLYRQWLTPQEIGARFGATQTDYQAVASYLKNYGLKVGMWPQREVLSVSGTLGQFQSAFGTQFGSYQFKGKPVVAPITAPHLPTTVPVTSMIGVMSAPLMSSYAIKGTNASFYGYSPQQVATGFDFSGAYANSINGSGINVGIIGTGPILNAKGGDDDTAGYGAFWHAQMAPVYQIAASPQPASTPNGGTGTGTVDPNPAGLAAPPPVTDFCSQAGSVPNYTTCNPEDIEAQLDTETVSSLAPGSSVLFYNAYNPSECVNPSTSGFDAPVNGACPSGDVVYPLEGISLVDDSIQQAIADNKADVISMSFGEPENMAAAFGYIGPANAPGIGQIEIASLAAEGTAVFVSSGDDGAWECFDPATGNPTGTPCASYPASDPNAVAVGAVNIPLDESGNLVGEIAAWGDNTTQGGNGSFRNNVGSGGGVSSVFNAPAWQAQTLGATMREIPDMSLDGDPNSGQSIMIVAAYPDKAVFAEGGTSMSAPEAAAQWSLVLQACRASATCNTGGSKSFRLGNPAPLFYAIYATSSLAKGTYAPKNFTPGLTYEHVFTDVIYGGNTGYPATPGPGQSTPPPTSGYESGPGYDQVTGLGAPATGHLIQAITGTKVP